MFGKKKKRYKQNPYTHDDLQRAFREGMIASNNNQPRSSNPYDKVYSEMLVWQWDTGWVAMDRHSSKFISISHGAWDSGDYLC